MRYLQLYSIARQILHDLGLNCNQFLEVTNTNSICYPKIRNASGSVNSLE